jgi:hypothetical protein
LSSATAIAINGESRGRGGNVEFWESQFQYTDSFDFWMWGFFEVWIFVSLFVEFVALRGCVDCSYISLLFFNIHFIWFVWITFEGFAVLCKGLM